jgi:hypothetical protein
MKYKILPAFLSLVLSYNVSQSEIIRGGEFVGGESIHRLNLLEPLGEGGFSFETRLQFLKEEIDTTAFDAHLGMAYGLFQGVDFAFYLPYMRMTNGPYSKYGQGDAVASVKLVKHLEAAHYLSWGTQISALIPTGYQKEIYPFPTFSQNEFGYGGRLLAEVKSRKIALIANTGVFMTEKGSQRDWMVGCGMRINLLKSLLMAVGEFTTTQAFAGGDAGSYAFAGAESHLPYIGLGLKVGAEAKLKEDRPTRLVIGASLTSRKVSPGVSRGILETERDYKKLMLFDFIDEDRDFLGDDIEAKVSRNLGSLDEVEVIEPDHRIPQEKASFNRAQALKLTSDSGANLLIFAQYFDFGYNDDKGLFLPYLIGFPRTEAYVSADIWVVDSESQKELYSGRVMGKASKLRGVDFFPTNKNSDTLFLTAPQKERLRLQAIDRFVDNVSLKFSDKLK